eukprot:gene4351-3165_t
MSLVVSPFHLHCCWRMTLLHLRAVCEEFSALFHSATFFTTPPGQPLYILHIYRLLIDLIGSYVFRSLIPHTRTHPLLMAAVQVYDSNIDAGVPHSGVKRLWNSRMRSASAEPSAACAASAAASTPRRSVAPSLASISGLTVTPSSREASQTRDEPAAARPFVAVVDSPGPRQPASAARLGRVKRSHTTSHRRTEAVPEVALDDVEATTTSFLLPPRKPETKLTVVFDLDETLVSNRHSTEAIPRPYYHAVLQGLRQKPEVEVVLWTASTKEVAVRVVSSLQDGDECCFDHLIPRDKMWFTEPTHTKDLRLLGRPMDSVIIVENSANCCKLNPQNAILVDDYHGQEKDAALVNVYYMIEAAIQLLQDGYSVGTSLRTLAKEQLLCDWSHIELPDIWKRAPIWSIAPHKVPAFGKFVKAKTTETHDIFLYILKRNSLYGD